MNYSHKLKQIFYKYIVIPFFAGLVLLGVLYYFFTKELVPYFFAVVWFAGLFLYYISSAWVTWYTYRSRKKTEQAMLNYQADCRVVFTIFLVGGLIGSFIKNWSFLLPPLAFGFFCVWLSKTVKQTDKNKDIKTIAGCFQRVYTILAFVFLLFPVVFPLVSNIVYPPKSAPFTGSGILIIFIGMPAYVALPLMSALSCMVLHSGGYQVKVRTKWGLFVGYILFGVAVIMALSPWLVMAYQRALRMGYWS